MDKKQAIELAWRKGRLRYLLRDQPSMFKAYDKFHAAESRKLGRIWYWNISRQFGKSYSGSDLALEGALAGPGRQVKYAAQDQKACRAIVFQQMEKLLRDCPSELHPQFRSQDGLYYFPHNGSRITVAGGDNENMGRLRGQTADLCLVDEGAHIAGDLRKLLFSVLLPQTTTTNGRVLVLTTPAESAGHYSTQLAYDCKARGTYSEFTIWDNRLLSDDMKREILQEYGWCDACWLHERIGEVAPMLHTCSTSWQREYLCKFVTDTANAVCQEFTQEAEKDIVVSNPRPEYFDAYTSLDGGFSDPAGLLWAHYDFERAKLVVESEHAQKGLLTDDIARIVMEEENRLWGEAPVSWPDFKKKRMLADPQLVRVMDVDPEKTSEFSSKHGMHWGPVPSKNVLVDANALNQCVRQRTLEIRPECKQLIRQLHNATWAGKPGLDGLVSKKTMGRNREDGHFDLVSSLIYMLKVVQWSHNPWPPAKKDLRNVYMPEHFDAEMSESDEALKAAFGLPEIGDF